MTTDKKQFSVALGPLAPKVSQQLRSSGLVHRGNMRISTIDKMADCISLLKIHGVLTETEAHNARHRLAKSINAERKPK